MTTLAQAADADPQIAEILSSPEQHTEAARLVRAHGFSTTEAAVRRWRRARDWTSGRQAALAQVLAGTMPASLDEQGVQLYDALTAPHVLPADPVSFLSECMEGFATLGQPDLRVVRKYDAEGIATVTVTAVSDQVAEAAAAIMAERIVKGEDHRCLLYPAGERNEVCLLMKAHWSYGHSESDVTRVFPPQTSATRYRRYAKAVIRRLDAAGWDLTGIGRGSLGFRHRSAPDPLDALLLPENMREGEERADREYKIRRMGL